MRLVTKSNAGSTYIFPEVSNQFLGRIVCGIEPPEIEIKILAIPDPMVWRREHKSPMFQVALCSASDLETLRYGMD